MVERQRLNHDKQNAAPPKKPIPKYPSINERLVVKHYIRCFDKTEAYLAAGFKGKNNAWKYFQRPMVQELLEEELKEFFVDMDLEKNRVLNGLLNIAFFDWRCLYDSKGHMKPMSSLPSQVTKVIQSVKVFYSKMDAGVVASITIPDRNRALELLGKYLSMFVDRIEGKFQVQVEHGVLMVPGMLTADKWQDAAKDQEEYQKKLLEETYGNDDGSTKH